MDNFRNTSKEFYEDLKRGKVENKDFERYIYGGHKAKYKDDRDKMEEMSRKEQLKVEREVKDQINAISQNYK